MSESTLLMCGEYCIEFRDICFLMCFAFVYDLYCLPLFDNVQHDLKSIDIANAFIHSLI